jgi:putative transposase
VDPFDRRDAVTLPRQILPGKSYLITRRCTQRQFLLRPSRITNQNVEYCLGLAAEHTGVLLHSVCVMSNHWHGVITDPDARLPEFLEIFHKLLAKAQNASLGRWENFWSSDKTSVVLLVSENDLLEKMAYTLANPTIAGLVKSPDEWPGVISHRLGESHEVDMPDVFFDEDGPLPDSVKLEFVHPPALTGVGTSDLEARLRCIVAKFVRQARNRMSQHGLQFLGRNVVLRQSPLETPRTDAPRRNLSPRIAGKSTSARITAIAKMRNFAQQYRAAWNAWRLGNRDTVFPHGTYALRIHAGVTCAQEPRLTS